MVFSVKKSDLTLPENYKWNAGTYIMGVSFLPGLGAFVADTYWGWEFTKPSTFREELNFKEAGPKLASHFKDLKQDTNPRPQCSCPKQVQMEEEANIGPKAKACVKHTDAQCNLATFPFRPPAIAFVTFVVLAGLVQSRGLLAQFIMMCACYALFCGFIGWVWLCVGGKKSEVPSTGVANTIAYVSKIKYVEQQELEDAPMGCEKVKIIAHRVWSYLYCWFKAVFCCEGFKVNHLIMLSKVLFVMILTEIMMPVSIVIYIVLRCAISTVTWRACSIIGIVEEVSVCSAIKKRLATMKYPGLTPTEGKAEAKAAKPDIEAGCCLSACGGCKDCGVCPGCGCCCDMCSLTCAICTPCCSMGCDFFLEDICWDIISGFLIIFKAEYYTTEIQRHLIEGRGGSQSEEEGQVGYEAPAMGDAQNGDEAQSGAGTAVVAAAATVAATAAVAAATVAATTEEGEEEAVGDAQGEAEEEAEEAGEEHEEAGEEAEEAGEEADGEEAHAGEEADGEDAHGKEEQGEEAHAGDEGRL